jgi:hypothetical protein
MGITALALDGSMALNDRREGQSTSDSAALAGGGAAIQIMKDFMPSDFYCGSSLASHARIAAIQAAQNAALVDNINLVADDPNNGVSVTCGSDAFRTYLDIKVNVLSETNTTFAKLLSRDRLTNTTESTVRVYPKQNIAFGNALATVGKSCGYGVGGINLNGGASVTALAGGVFSNSCIKGSNNTSFNMPGGGNVTYYGANGFSGTVTGGSMVQIPEPLPDLVIPDNPCTNPPATDAGYKTITDEGEFTPGYYLGFSAPKKDGAKLLPGLYCIKGNIDAQGGAKIFGSKVTIFMMNGSIDFAANSVIYLTAPDCETPDASCGVPPAIRGIVIYFNPAYQRTLSFAPGTSSYFEGTILGPTTTVVLQGHADPDAMHSQIVCNNYTANGNTNLTINLSGAETYQNPSSLEILK